MTQAQPSETEKHVKSIIFKVPTPSFQEKDCNYIATQM
jgi:hypothetical protein